MRNSGTVGMLVFLYERIRGVLYHRDWPYCLQ